MRVVPLRVVVVHPNTDLYGSDRMLLRTVGALRRAGADVELHVPDRGAFTKRLDELGVSWRLTPFPVLRRTLMNPGGLLRLALSLVTCLPSVVRSVRRADVVYVNTVNCGLWLLVSRLARTRNICHVRENEPQMGRAQRMVLLAPLLLASRIITNSASTRDWVLAAFPQLGPRTEVVYNGLELPPTALADPLTHDDRLRLLVVGRLSWRKGQDVAIRALAELRGAGVPASLTLAGDCYPGYEQWVTDLHELAARLGVTEQVHFAGFQADLDPFWAQADVALVPSLLEPFGNVAVEAMAAGLPVVASHVQGLAEIVQHEVNGLLVPPGDPVALAAAVTYLFEARHIARTMAAGAAGYVRRRFALERYNAQVTDLIMTTAPR